MNLEMLPVILPALVVGIMIALVHAPLGIEVLRRGIIFIDLAIAQIAGLGLLMAMEIFHLENVFLQQLVALVFALLAALAFLFCEKRMQKFQEAIIGCSYVLAASLAVLLLSQNPHGAEAMAHLLSGQILFVSWQDVAHHAPIYAAVLAFWFLFPKLRSGLGFYALFAVTITSSVQLVGVYVVFASLILPALAAVNFVSKVIPACLCGLLAVLVGLIAAMLTDMPAGPLVVLCYVLLAIVFALWSVRRSAVIE